MGSNKAGRVSEKRILHPPQRLISAIPGDKNVERETTLKLAKTYGREKTRGAAWCEVKLQRVPGQLDGYTKVLVRSKQIHISHWISAAEDSISKVDDASEVSCMINKASLARQVSSQYLH